MGNECFPENRMKTDPVAKSVNGQKGLLATTASIGMTEVVVGVALFAKYKLAAVLLGPEGFGVYSLLQGFFGFTAFFTAGFLAFGVTKYVAYYRSLNDNQGLVETILWPLFIASGLFLSIAVVEVLFHTFIIQTFLSPEIHNLYFYLYIIGFLGLTFSPLFIAILQGMIAIRQVVFSRITIACFEVVAIGTLIYFFKMMGFFVGIAVSAVFAVLVLGRMVFNTASMTPVTFAWNRNILKQVLLFGGISQVAGLVYLATLYFQRKLIVDIMSIEHVGMFMAAFLLMQYMAFVNNAAGFYFFPKMCESIGKKERQEETNRFLLIIIMTNIPLSLIVILFGDLILIVAFGKEFLPIAPILFTFVIGHYFATTSTAFHSSILGMARLQVHMFLSVLKCVLWILPPLFFLKAYGLITLGAGIMFGGVVGCVLSAFYIHKELGFSFSKQTITLFLFGLVALIVAIGMRDVPFYIRIGFLVAAVSGQMIFITSSQRRTFSQAIRQVYTSANWRS